MTTITRPATEHRFVTGVRSTGVTLAVATTAWAVAVAVTGEHEGYGWQSILDGVTALAFQFAIIRFLLLQFRTGAMGEGRVAKGFYVLEFGFLAGAIVSSTLDTFWLMHGTALWAVFDACWPLSMLTLVGIGIRVAVAGRWTGIVRWYTLWAQSWFVATIPLVLIVPAAGQIVGSAHLIVGYAALGAILARIGTTDPRGTRR